MICEYCGNPFMKDDVKLNSLCVVRNSDDIYEFGLTTCVRCFSEVCKNGKDMCDRIEFPYGKQIVLYKVKKYLYPTMNKKKKLEEWKLFSPLKTKGKKQNYS